MELKYFYLDNDPAISLSPIEGVIFWMAFAFLITSFIWFFIENKKLIRKFPSYQGKYLWTILFFPISYTLGTTIVAISGLAYNLTNLIYEGVITYSWLITIIAIGLSGYLYRQTIKLQTIIFEWKSEYYNKAKNIISIIISGGFLSTILYNILNGLLIYSKFHWWYSEAFMEEIITPQVIGIFFYVFVFALIYFLSLKRLKNLSKEFGHIDNYTQKNNSSSQDDFISSSEGIKNLKELKQLLEDEIISTDEFNEMKRGILSKGI